MATRTEDTAFASSDLSSTLADEERLAFPTPQDSNPVDNLGAFRGLAYAVILQFLFGFIGMGVWMLIRRVR